MWALFNSPLIMSNGSPRTATAAAAAATATAAAATVAGVPLRSTA
jgi:hypothetical protein